MRKSTIRFAAIAITMIMMIQSVSAAQLRRRKNGEMLPF